MYPSSGFYLVTSFGQENEQSLKICVSGGGEGAVVLFSSWASEPLTRDDGQGVRLAGDSGDNGKSGRWREDMRAGVDTSEVLDGKTMARQHARSVRGDGGEGVKQVLQAERRQSREHREAENQAATGSNRQQGSTGDKHAAGGNLSGRRRDAVINA